MLADCQSVDGAIEEHGAKTKTVLSRIAPLASDLHARAAVIRDDVPAIEPRVVMNATPEKTDNAAVVYYEDLLALGELGNVYARMVRRGHAARLRERPRLHRPGRGSRGGRRQSAPRAHVQRVLAPPPRHQGRGTNARRAGVAEVWRRPPVTMACECTHCKAKVNSGAFDWVLARIEHDESYTG